MAKLGFTLLLHTVVINKVEIMQISSNIMKMFRCIVIILVIIPLFLVLGEEKISLCPAVVDREQWGASKALSIEPLAKNPAPIVVVHHADCQPCLSLLSCTKKVQNIQHYHISTKRWNDIGYNFLIGGEGTIFEGRGWGITGAHAKGWNNRSIGICLIGNFQEKSPPSSQLLALEALIACGVKNENIAKNYSLIGHRQATRTACPGDILFSIVKNMSHFDANPQ
ncbi:peptidoglycan-recognition protein 2-like [Euwallacea similis]|uniref:peptidoglycan-recognition protein 2-like n=1 Tax=Euwallacea similis TaxID=1736056 RepID=UPI00344E5515